MVPFVKSRRMDW